MFVFSFFLKLTSKGQLLKCCEFKEAVLRWMCLLYAKGYFHDVVVVVVVVVLVVVVVVVVAVV